MNRRWRHFEKLQLNNNDASIQTYALISSSTIFVYSISKMFGQSSMYACNETSKKHGMQNIHRRLIYHTIIAINLNIYSCDILTVRNRFIVRNTTRCLGNAQMFTLRLKSHVMPSSVQLIRIYIYTCI